MCTRTRTRAHPQARTRARIAQAHAHAHALSQQGVAIAAPGQAMHGVSQSGAWMPPKRIKTAIKGLLTHGLGHWCTQQENELIAPKNSIVIIPHVQGV